jgi:23S rRNA pseudouridine2604 synthase
MADKKIASRREADELIKRGKVKINGRMAKIGEAVGETDKVTVEGNLKNLVYLAFNKPEGIVTHSPQKGETSIADILNLDCGVFPLGRLDKESRGLIILSNDGRATGRLLSPEYYHEKEYEVEVNKRLEKNFIERMEQGVKLDNGRVTRKCVLKKLDDFSFSIILTEGKNRQIRRMCESLGYKVTDLNRIRIMNIKLGNLKIGSRRIISGKERGEFLSELKIL